jgi:ferritin-like protein
MSNNSYEESFDGLSDKTCDMHRAIQSLIEELQAIDYYNQRADLCQDSTLTDILCHNRDEEKEHAAMLLEWIRRNDSSFEQQLKAYIFTGSDNKP